MPAIFPSFPGLRSALLLMAGTAAVLPWAATAQDSDPLAPKAELTIGQQLAVENGDLIGITPLSLSYRSGTRSQVLEFTLSAPLRENDPDSDRTVSLGDPDARLFYRRFVRNSSIETEFSYRELDLDREVFFDPFSETLVTLDNGSLAYTEARLNYAFGSQSKLGGELGLRYQRRDYRDTVDPDLVDGQTKGVDLRLYLEPIPVLRARLIASGTTIDTDGGTDSRSTQLGAGASIQLDKVTNLDAQLTHDTIRREEDLTGIVDEVSGLGADIGLTRARPDGEWSLSLSSDPGTDGRRDNLLLGRSLERPGYQLSVRAGMTRFAGNLDPVFQSSYARKLSTISEVSAQLERRAVTDEDGDEAINTSLSASYSRQLSDLSSLSGSIRYRATEIVTGDGEDARSIAFDVNYSRSLNADFSLVAGASLVRSDDQNDTKRDDDRVYLGVNRAFSWFP